MNREEQFRRKNDLFKVFMQHVLTTPQFSERVPQDAEVIFLPENDPELREANLALAKQSEAEDKRVIFVKVTLIPETRTVFVPRMELAQSS